MAGNPSVRSNGSFNTRMAVALVARLGLAAILACAGCRNANWNKWENWRLGTASGPATAPVVATRPAEQGVPTPLEGLTLRSVVVQTIDFGILRVRAAAGTFSRSEKIWNPISEDVLPADTQMMLHNNGLRIGVGKHASWPQIKAALDAEKVEVSQDEQVLQNSVPLNIEVNPLPRDQTVFLIRSDGTMPGAFFPQSTTALRIEYWIAPNAPDTVMIELIPEIRLARTAGQSNLAVAALQNTTAGQPCRPLRELTARLRVGPGEFFAIGPSRIANQDHLAGSLLLAEEIDGRKLESMCFITPKILSSSKSSTP